MIEDDRLSRISTIWTNVHQAHQTGVEAADQARWKLIERYQGAVYRYLLGALRDQDAAEEAFQDFALGIMQGKFHAANETKGRFRDYLRTALSNLINSRRRKQQTAPLQIDTALGEAINIDDLNDDRFIESWRSEILARVWQRMSEQDAAQGTKLFTVLKGRVDHPQLSSTELTVVLQPSFQDKPLNAALVRKMLERARDRFSDLLFDEIARSLQTHDARAIEEELISLRLHSYCKTRVKKE